MTPNRKVMAGGITGSIASVVVWLLGQFEVEVPPDVAVAIATIIIFAVSYLVPETKEPTQ